MKIRIMAIACLIALFMTSFLSAQKPLADWTFVIFMRPSSNLQEFAKQNMASIARGGVAENVHVLVQVNNEYEAQRFQIAGNTIVLDNECSTECDDEDNLVATMKWAASEFPARHYCLVIWGNGAGVLDQSWASATQTWEYEESNYPTNEICVSCTLATVPRKCLRGVMFEDSTRRFLSTASLSRALATISTEVLGGRKLDILGMDACKMAMVEMAYELRDRVQYLVGCENCTPLADGWNYEQIFAEIHTTDGTPEALCRLMVRAFDAFYAANDHTKTYTESAIRLDRVEPIVQALKAIVDEVRTTLPDLSVLRAAKLARSHAISMCNAPCYIDLYSWLEAFAHELKSSEAGSSKLLAAIDYAKQMLLDAVVLSVNGSLKDGVKGLSFYFPARHLDTSYGSTAFARNTAWQDLVGMCLPF